MIETTGARPFAAFACELVAGHNRIPRKTLQSVTQDCTGEMGRREGCHE